MKLRYPTATEAELRNFIRIYLQLCSMNRTMTRRIFFWHGLRISRNFFAGRYSKSEINHNYVWMNENNETNLHFP